MPREYAPLHLSIWNDEDFLNLTDLEQRLYFVLLTTSGLSHCGVADWRPKKLARKSKDGTVVKVEQAAAGLVAAHLILVDDETEEVLIRAFIRRDGLMKQPNQAVAMTRAYGDIASRPLRAVVVREVVRLHKDSPDLPSWAGKASKEPLADLMGQPAMEPAEAVAELAYTPSSEPSSEAPAGPASDPSGNPSGKGSGKGSPNPSSGRGSNPSGKGSGKGQPPRPAPSPTTFSVPSEPSASKRAAAERSSSGASAGAFEEAPEVPAERGPADLLADAIYDHAGTMVKWIAVRQVAERALKAGHTQPQIEAALKHIYDRGKPMTLEAVGQVLSGRVAGVVAIDGARRPSTTDQRVQAAYDLAAELDAEHEARQRTAGGMA